MRLDVWIDGVGLPAGKLEALDNGAVAFHYSDDYLASARLPLSQSLPLQTEVYGDAITRAFFDNLLPENDQTRRLIEREGIDRDDIAGILYHMGADCSGAISCLPEGAAPVKMPGDLTTDYAPLSEDAKAAIMASLCDYQRLPDETGDPSPLAGVQGKIALAVLPDGRWALPKPGLKVPSTHILKVPARADQGDVIHEWASGVLLRWLGLPASLPARVTIAGVHGLLIPRFDRVVVDNNVTRLHQEDFAQALGLPRSLKYERNGRDGRSFSAAAAARLIDRLRVPAQGKRLFVLATLLNLALGNNDNHAKNHAVLYQGSAIPELAPLYDIVPVRMNAAYTDRLAFDIGAAQRFEDITADDLAAFLALFDLEGGRYRRFIDREVGPMFARLDALAESLGREQMKGFDDLIGNNLLRLRDLLGLDFAVRDRDLYVARGGGWQAGS
jgi:serine/threonine-protein kinase HipA